jgi:hypothetical protein
MFEGCRGRPPCLPIRRAATGGRPYEGRSYKQSQLEGRALGDATQTVSFLGVAKPLRGG